MKRLVVLMLVVVLAFTALPFNTAFAASETDSAMEAVIWEDFSRSEVGEKFNTTQLYHLDEGSSADCVNTLGALGATNAAKLNYDKENGYYVDAKVTGFSIVYNTPKSLKDVEYMMYYVKLPASAAANEKTENWMNMTLSISHLTTSNEYIYGKPNMYAQILWKNGSKWESHKYNSSYIYLPAGFEGYIKIPMSNNRENTVKYSFDKYRIKETMFKVSKMGGETLGALYVNAIYAGYKDSDSVKIKLNGEKTARYLTTGLTDADLAPNKALIDSAMKVEVLQDFAGFQLGTSFTTSKALITQRMEEEAVGTLIPSKFGPLNTPTLEISSPTLGGFMNIQPIHAIKNYAFRKMDDMKAILVYINCAEHHPLDSERGGISLTLRTEKNGKSLWPQMGEGKSQYLQKGTSQWYTPETDNTGRIYLPNKFEGYVMVDISEFRKNPVYDDLEDRKLLSINIGFNAIGGECGNVYVGGIYAVTEKTGKNKTLMTFNGCDVYDLSTNGIATGGKKEIKSVKVGDILVALPAITDTSYKITPKKTTADTATLSWAEHKNASKYKIEVFQTIKNVETVTNNYKCVSSKTVDAKDGLETAVDGLESATRFIALVTALDANGGTIEVYDSTRFSTRMKSGAKLPNQNVQVDKSEETEENEEGSGILIYIIIGVAAVLLIGGGVTAFIIIKKKKNKK